jgi:hypothetical protein
MCSVKVIRKASVTAPDEAEVTLSYGKHEFKFKLARGKFHVPAKLDVPRTVSQKMTQMASRELRKAIVARALAS